MISVVIPVYNAEPYLRGCLDSVLRSVYQDFEVILVNDGSADGSLAVCREYASRDDRVHLISQRNQGVSAARNRGLEACRGEWVVFVDADDPISPDFLGLIAREEYQDQDLLLFDFARKEADLTAEDPAPEALRCGPEDVPGLMRSLILRLQLAEGGNLNFVSPCAKAYRKDLIDRHAIRFSPELFYGEDKLFNAEYLAHTVRCVYLPAPVYYYNIHLDSSSRRFNPGLVHNLPRQLELLKDILEDSDMFPHLKTAFFAYALENLGYIMVWTIFCPENTDSFGKKLQACRTLRQNEIFCGAIATNRFHGSWARKVLINLFRLRLYPAVGLLTKIWHCCTMWKGADKMGTVSSNPKRRGIAPKPVP